MNLAFVNTLRLSHSTIGIMLVCILVYGSVRRYLVIVYEEHRYQKMLTYSHVGPVLEKNVLFVTFSYFLRNRDFIFQFT